MARALTAEQIAERKKTALELGRKGVSRHRVAELTGTRYDRIKEWFDEAHIAPNPTRNSGGNKGVNPIWTNGNSEAQRTFHTVRAAKAARAQLKALGAV